MHTSEQECGEEHSVPRLKARIGAPWEGTAVTTAQGNFSTFPNPRKIMPSTRAQPQQMLGMSMKQIFEIIINLRSRNHQKDPQKCNRAQIQRAYKESGEIFSKGGQWQDRGEGV